MGLLDYVANLSIFFHVLYIYVQYILYSIYYIQHIYGKQFHFTL